jgi:AAA family ATP:ADP antiporter
MGDEDPDIVKQAIASAGNTLSPEFINRLSEFLGQEEYRSFAKNALLNYGPAMVEKFAEIIRDNIWSVELLHHIPSIVEQIGTQQSVELLFSLLDHSDIGLRMEALRSLNTLKINHANLRFHQKDVMRRILDEAHLYLETLAALYSQTSVQEIEVKNGTDEAQENQLEARKSLTTLLERRLDGNLERIFRLLGLKYPFEDILNIYQGIQSKKPEMRINAVEFLDNLLETNLKRVLVPIVETALLDNISEDALKSLNLKIPDEFHCLSMLLSGPDVKISLATLFLISQIKDKKYIPLVANFTQSENLKIKTFANQALIELLK